MVAKRPKSRETPRPALREELTMRFISPRETVLILTLITVSFMLFACGETTESADTAASVNASTQATLEAATDECFDGCMERFGDDTHTAECAEMCASIGGDSCQSGCEARGGDAEACEARCAEAGERDSGAWSQECYDSCLERGLDAVTCREACSERDETGARCDDDRGESEGDDGDDQRTGCEEGEELSRGDVTYICQDGEWVEAA